MRHLMEKPSRPEGVPGPLENLRPTPFAISPPSLAPDPPPFGPSLQPALRSRPGGRRRRALTNFPTSRPLTFLPWRH